MGEASQVPTSRVVDAVGKGVGMSVLLRITPGPGGFDGESVAALGELDMHRIEGLNAAFDIVQRDPGSSLGIFDFTAILNELEERLGNFLDRGPVGASATLKVTDVLMERAVLASSMTPTNLNVGTQTPAVLGLNNGLRLQTTPTLVGGRRRATQLGGSGRIADDPDLVGGCVPFPNGLRFFFFSEVPAGTEQQLLVWLVPFADPRVYAELCCGCGSGSGSSGGGGGGGGGGGPGNGGGDDGGGGGDGGGDGGDDPPPGPG